MYACVDLFLHVCMFVWIYILMGVCIHVCRYFHMHMCMCAYMCTYVCVCVCTYVCVCIYMYDYMYPCTWTCVCVCMYICVHMYVHRSMFYKRALLKMRDVTHSYVWHDSSIRVEWHIHMCDMSHLHVWHDSFICAACIIYICSYLYKEVTATRLQQEAYETKKKSWFAYLLHDSSICVRDMTHPYAWHDSFIFVTWHMFICVTWWRVCFVSE